jgi:DNA gyrase inhibitor GyrI
MTVAEVAIRGGLDLELRALQWLYGSWLPRSGFVPDDQPAFEAWRGRPSPTGRSTSSWPLNCPSDGRDVPAGSKGYT